MNEGTRKGRVGEIDPLIGVTLSGRYVVHSLVGQGGMGKVYDAQQIPLGRSVALKVLDARHVDREFHRRFFQEAAILARLKSRHTVVIYDYGRDGDLYFIAMELVAGASLDRVLATEGPLSAPRAINIAEQICRSLREAHAQGIIHRDLKPANVMLTAAEDGEELAKVLDFGLAKRVDRAGQDETQAHVVPGSPKYMAPEAIRQLPIDGRVDMYALGVMLYYMLTGEVPFDRESPMDILRAHLHEAPRPLRVANPHIDVPDALEHIVMRCLAKTPEERFPGMQELLDTLRAFSRGQQRSAGPRWTPGTGGHAPISTMPPSSGSMAAMSAQPPSNPSIPPSLHLDRRDARASAKSSLRPSGSRGARSVWFVGAGLAFGIAAAAIWQADRSDAANNAPPAATATPTPAVPTPAPEPAAPAPMVITPEEAAAAPSHVVLNVSSEPPGAVVLVRGKRLGVTPGRFDWTEEPDAKGPLIVQLRRTGYAAYSTKATLDAPEIEIVAMLQPVRKKLDLPAVDVRSRPEASRPPADDSEDDSTSDDESGSEPAADSPKPEAPPAPSANASDSLAE